jgi:hypothetical protein
MDEKRTAFQSIKNVPDTSWKKLGEKRIYFGHQSVGYNIVEGISDVLKANPQIKLNIIETNNAVDFSVPIFAHSQVGKNEDPKSKCEAFADLMERGMGEGIDIAFLKFCFVDVTGKTDVNRLVAEYGSTINALKKRYPKVTYVHITVPLMTVQTGPKGWIKKLIGRPIGGYEDNIGRGEYNRKLRSEYGRKDPLFDLAALESTFPDGKRCTFSAGGKAYETLVPEYTDDGGHLNQKGRRWVAEQFLVFLANLSTKE